MQNDKNYISKLSNVVANVVTFKSLPNQPSYLFYLSNVKRTIILDEDNNWGQICNQKCLSNCKQFYEMLMDLDLENLLLVQYNILKSNVTGRYDYEMSFMKGLVFRSGEDSQMGSGTIYATPKYNNNTQYASLNDIPRYDYVFIKSRNNVLTLAKILIMFFLKPVQVTYKGKQDDNSEDDNSEVDNEEAHICLIVQYLIKSERNNQANISIGECYIWASSGIDRSSFSYDLITVQSIARPAFVIPGVGNAKSTTCKHDDIFMFSIGATLIDQAGKLNLH